MKILVFRVLMEISMISCIGIGGIVRGFDNFFRRFEVPQEPNGKDDLSYDFIIVGSGSSGAILANRLSEIAPWRILLLEAGNPANKLTEIPILAPLFQLTPYNWNYTTEPQEGACLGMEGGICAWPRGKALGGTSVINYMIYTRGNRKDYDKWGAEAEGWSYEHVLPYFLKSEDCNLGEECKSRYHRKGGYLSIEYPYKSKLTDSFLEASVEMGEKILDYNGEEFMGFSPLQANLKRGRRHSTADAFIYPFKRRNLKIITSARVTKVLIDSRKKVYGVEFRKKGRTYRAKTSKEVILSAGVFNSPQLLMLSGIGPKQHLQELGIPLVQNLPVGELLYDHIAYLGLAFKINQTVIPKDLIFRPEEIVKWLSRGKGIYSSLAGVEAVGYINTGSIPDPNYPDIELIFIASGSLESDYGKVVAREVRLKREIYNKVYKPLEPPLAAWTILPMLLHPKSRGYLKLRSSNPYDPPKLHGNYFTHPQDIETLVSAIRYIQKMSRTKAFQRYGSTLHDIPIPNCEQTFDSDEYWRCALRTVSSTLHHQVGTCKMGAGGGEGAVVDPRLRVQGVGGLRVADSSVIPVTISAHTNAASMMIGEKAADVIKEDWGAI